MKKQLILLLVLGVLFSLGTQAQLNKQIEISGKVEFLNRELFKKYDYVWLKKGIGKQLITVDSTKVGKDGNFSFKIDAKPALYQLDILKWQTANFWADADIKLNCRGYDTARVKAKNSGYIKIESNSAANRLINTAVYGKYLDKKLLDEVLNEGYAAQRALSKDSSWYKAYLKQDIYHLIYNQSDERIQVLIQNHPDNPATVFLLSLLDPKKQQSYILSELNKRVPASPDYEEAMQLKKEILNDVATAEITKKGIVLANFAYPRIDGKNIALRSFRGKYVIIDFWASWCGPCRKSIPKIKELYALYNSKGLEVLSVSIDTDKNAWRKAMADENMPWAQVLSPNKDKTLKDFSIQGVPTLFFIDREGRIVEKFTGYSPRLDELLKSTF